jgi:LuxR family maltose regulon positive regulatory protein
VPRLVAGLVERPRLFALLDRALDGPVTLVCAPAGSGKTMLVSSWLRHQRPAASVAWVYVDRGEADATRFWTAALDALRHSGAVAADDPLATLVPSPSAHHPELVEAVLEWLGRLSYPVVLVVEDLHQLCSAEALAGLEEVLARAPADLHVILLSRRDPALGLHRLRLSGELTEIRAADLEFTADEAAALLAAAGVAVQGDDVVRLRGRTEGWAAGLRLAAMSLARHPEPERFVAEFSGSERTVADYLLSEVLASLPPEVRRLLLRTCILERVSGPLADLLTGRGDGTRLLQDLEQANAFVVAVDVGRTWFRYHHLLADLLRLELSREEPLEVPGLHRLAAGWFADYGRPLDAIRHAQLGEDWALATELLGRHWFRLILDGEEATLATLLAGLPAGLAEADAELAAIAAADRLAEHRWAEADALIATAQRALPAAPDARQARAATALATVQLFRARRLGGVESVVDEALALLRVDEPGGDAADPELVALALLNVGVAETWTLRLLDAERHLERGLALGRDAGRPYLEVGCLGCLGIVANLTHRLDLAEERLRAAVAVAERAGWAAHPMIAAPCVTLGSVLLDHGATGEAEGWLDRADAILAGSPGPTASVALRHGQGMLALTRERFADAAAAFRESERLARQLRAPFFLGDNARQWRLRAELGDGDPEPARAALAAPGADDSAVWRNLRARVCLADQDAAGAAAAVAPVLAGASFVFHPIFEMEALSLDALARTRLEEDEAAERSVERALALSEPQGRVLAFLTVPGIAEVLRSHPVHRTAHAAHLRTLLDLLAGAAPAQAGGGPPAEPAEPLTDRELAVLRFLPTNLSAGEIGGELFLSVHTVKTHMRKLYAKLDVHTRAEAVQRGRALGLLAPSRRGG